MQKRNLKQLALLGLTSGLLITNQLQANDAKTDKKDTSTTVKKDKTDDTKTDNYSGPSSDNPDDGNLGYHLMTEDELILELNPKGVKLYKSLDEEGKALAREVASQRCQGTNRCKGLNACKTDKHDCAGLGSCKNTSKCAIGDKNLAVKLAADYMAKKRAGALGK